MLMDTTKYSESIKKTGFVLEYSIASQLRQAGWIVINNKFYIDDHNNDVREIDLVAYKSASVEALQVYTTLILSCKKSEKNVWALLSKDIGNRSPEKSKILKNWRS